MKLTSWWCSASALALQNTFSASVLVAESINLFITYLKTFVSPNFPVTVEKYSCVSTIICCIYVLCYFNQVCAVLKLKLLKSYCGSLYRCELWNLFYAVISDVCIAWRKGLHRVWSLPYNTRTALLAPLSD